MADGSSHTSPVNTFMCTKGGRLLLDFDETLHDISNPCHTATAGPSTDDNASLPLLPAAKQATLDGAASVRRRGATEAAADVEMLSAAQAGFMRLLLRDSMQWNIANPPTAGLRERFDPDRPSPKPEALVLPPPPEDEDGTPSTAATSPPASPASGAGAVAPPLPPPWTTSTPRIAIVISNYDGVVDGVTLTLNDLVGWLEDRGVPVMVLTVDYGDTSEFGPRTRGSHIVRLAGQPIFPCSKYKYRTLFTVPEAAFEALEAFRPTVVHAASPCSLCKSVLEWAREAGVARVGTFHTDFAAYMQYHGMITSWLEQPVWWGLRWFNSAVSRLYAPTLTMVRRLAEHNVGIPAHPYDVLGERVCVGEGVPPELAAGAEAEGQPLLGVWGRGVDLAAFHPRHRSARLRTAWGVPEGGLVVVTVGRLVREKNLSALGAVAKGLQEAPLHCPPLTLVVVGDGPERGSLQAACPPGTVFTGALSGEDLGAAYASADLFLFTSDTETFGRVNIEAMASGLPVVAAGAGGTLDIVRPGVEGFLCDPKDPSAFTTALHRLSMDPGLRGDMGRRALERAAAFDWEALFSGLLQEYKLVGYDGKAGEAPAPAAFQDASAEAGV